MKGIVKKMYMCLLNSDKSYFWSINDRNRGSVLVGFQSYLEILAAPASLADTPCTKMLLLQVKDNYVASSRRP